MLGKDEKLKEQKKKEIATILQGKFVKCMLKGLENHISYIKLQYANFIKDSITIISDFLTADNLRDSIDKILKEYYISLIKLKPDDEEEEWNEDIEVFIIDLDERSKKKNHSFMKKATNTTMIIDKSVNTSSLGNEKSKYGLGNDTETMLLRNTKKNKVSNNPFSKSQQNQNQIFVLLEAIKSILNFYLKFYEVFFQKFFIF